MLISSVFPRFIYKKDKMFIKWFFTLKNITFDNQVSDEYIFDVAAEKYGPCLLKLVHPEAGCMSAFHALILIREKYKRLGDTLKIKAFFQD